YSPIDGWFRHKEKPAPFHLQQLYGGVRWRSAFAYIGLKQYSSLLFGSKLHSGDFVRSGNARPVPGVGIGLNHFVNIPLTRGALQIQGEALYGMLTDNNWLRNHYNYYSYNIALSSIYHYKRLYFRTKPDLRLSVTFGMQSASLYCGDLYYYHYGVLSRVVRTPFKIKDLLNMTFTASDGMYYKGSTLGSWDMKARYLFGNGDRLYAYFQWPWEDGSGVGRMNGMDGVWGLEWRKATPGIVHGAVFEYFTFMNQSGPIDYAPIDWNGTTLPGHTSGADDYYNNTEYPAYAMYGMGLGSPIFPSPLYNRDGYMRYVDTRLYGFHAGLEGTLIDGLDYRLLCGWRKAFGSGYIPRKYTVEDFSLAVELNWRLPRNPHLAVMFKGGIDRGCIYGDNHGVMLGVSYTGNFNMIGK
ncbi:MAG: capsule assembly Wzi family protein, partial [Muribaculaceae bacterium]|nr:capsule assembly Wzi family protein [Muribaculaceae bacterium]